MINPQPINSSSSPYSTQNQSNPTYTPATANQYNPHLPSSLAAPTKKNSKRNWKKIIGFTFLTLVVAVATYASAQYSHLKKLVIISHEGESSSALNISNPDTVDTTLFKKAGDGRFNIVIVGMGGENHPGGMLTDSIQVMSVDTINKSITTTSIPRDLYVNIPGFGKSKINEAYQDGEQKKKGGGPAMVRQVVGTVLGINISNFVMIDFAGAKDLVDALGGIEVNVPQAIYDPTFPADNTIDYSPFSISAGVQKMNGTTALKYARSRETTSDFDRSKRQQLIIQAMKEKALSLNILSNPNKLNSMMNALGNHLKTDLQTTDIKALMGIYKDVDENNTNGFVLDTSAKLGLLKSGSSPIGAYISYPVLGVEKYGDIQQWFQKNSPDPLLTRENSTITVLNCGSATKQQLEKFVQKLNDYGYKATLGTNSVKSTSKTAIYYRAKDQKKLISKNYISSLLGADIKTDANFTYNTDFAVIYVPEK